MARGFPSMAALLGVLAIAGYQNRDKLAELLKNAQASGQAGPGSTSGGGLAGGLGGLLGGLGGLSPRGGVGGLLNGGLGELLESFKKNGQGDVADSWVSSGPNKDLSQDKLKSAIGPDVLSHLSQQTGLPEDELLKRLSRELPAAVDQYTPDGRLPDPDDVPANSNNRTR